MKTKAAVEFEHPAQGPHHCSQCVHFRAPGACALVAGRIAKGDWCQLWKGKR